MGHHYSSRLTATLNLCPIYMKITNYMTPSHAIRAHKKFEINSTNIMGDCQSGRKVVPHDCKSDLPLSS